MYQVSQGLCNGCEACVAACPTGAITVADGRAMINAAECRECGDCAAACPQGAIQWANEKAAIRAVPVVGAIPAVTEGQLTAEVLPGARPRSVWRASFWPALGSALVWAGRELLPGIIAAWRAVQPAISASGYRRLSRSGLAASTRRRVSHRHRWGRA